MLKTTRPGKLAPLNSPRVVIAAGGLVWRSSARKRLIVIHRARYDDWTIPKGKWDAEAGETVEACALREVDEETCCKAKLASFADVLRYNVKGAHKFVFFWNMLLKTERTFKASEEVDRIEWLTPDEAIARLTHADERRLIRQFRRP